ncbi:MAG: UDP-N-acetylmuramate--L-alanine ligase [Acidobacteriaceae bacterium]
MTLPGHFLFAPTHRIHFIGIGGIGMSGIAEILLTMGYAVSGSDLRRTAATGRLTGLGATIYTGHAAANVADCDVVVTSSAVPADNPEVAEARARKIPVIQRAEMLSELMRLKYGIAVAGMHGKTTTTSMIAAVMSAGGGEGNLDPTVVVGGRVDALGSNARLGSSKYLVAEADESDRSFLKLSPVLAVVTNLDREHMDCYRDIADVEGAFVEFMDRVPFYGATTACVDNALLRGVLPRVHRRVYTYGESADADFRLHLLQQTAGPVGPGHAQPDHSHWRFEVGCHGQVLGPFTLHVPGRHNVLNATAAIAIGVQLGVSPEGIAAGLAGFRGVDRRFQIKGVVRGVTVVDDYGHHPTEIMATLRAARDAGYARVYVLFQPHRYTRTRDLEPEFARAFADADSLQVLDIYAASEQPIPGVDAQGLVEAIRRTGTVSGGVEYAESMAAGVASLAQAAREGDVILTLGAGNVSQAGAMLLDVLRAGC